MSGIVAPLPHQRQGETTNCNATQQLLYVYILHPGICMGFLQFVAFENEEEARIKKEGQVVSPSLFFMKQTIGNACGTVGLLHALGNCTDKVAFSEWHTIGIDPSFPPRHVANSQDVLIYIAVEDGFLKTFFEKTKDMTPEERAEYLEKDDVSGVLNSNKN